MEAAYEDAYFAAEEAHPWFRARRALFTWLARGERGKRVLDYGCGSGIFLAHLKAHGFTELAGVEPSENLRRRFRDPSIPLHRALPDGAPFDAVFALDVLEHLDDDAAALRAIHARLAPGGRLYVSVPAHPFLWSRHDDLNLHKRRYRKKELCDRLRAAGFAIRRMTWWNACAFVPIAAMRLLRIRPRGSELDRPTSPAVKAAGALLALENAVLRVAPLPFGVSLIAVAEKPR
jgi:SAM-dependent methyltransferase